VRALSVGTAGLGGVGFGRWSFGRLSLGGFGCLRGRVQSAWRRLKSVSAAAAAWASFLRLSEGVVIGRSLLVVCASGVDCGRNSGTAGATVGARSSLAGQARSYPITGRPPGVGVRGALNPLIADQLVFFLARDQRACAAFRAPARRSSAVSFFARAVPPSAPQRRNASSQAGGASGRVFLRRGTSLILAACVGPTQSA
jgi:hypothetical protein